MFFLLDQKEPKNQGQTEICLSRLRNSGKTKTRPAAAGLKQFVFLFGISSPTPGGKFQMAVLKNKNLLLTDEYYFGI